MIIDIVISVLSDFLEVEKSEISEDTSLFLEYDLEEEDIETIIEIINNKLDIEIDIDEFCELDTVEEFAEYIESLCN